MILSRLNLAHWNFKGREEILEFKEISEILDTRSLYLVIYIYMKNLYRNFSNY